MTRFAPPVNYSSYGVYLWQYVTDKTGTVFQTLSGNVGPNTPWGVRVWRCPPNQPPQLVAFFEQCNGSLAVDDINKRLIFLGVDRNSKVFCETIDGYIYPSDCPDQTIVNINESQLATMRQSIATSLGLANAANNTATNASNTANDLAEKYAGTQAQVDMLQRRLDALTAQVNGLLTPSQVADLVWQKIKDINYLYRLAFNAWPGQSADPDIKAYVADLVNLIKKVKP